MQDTTIIYEKFMSKKKYDKGEYMCQFRFKDDSENQKDYCKFMPIDRDFATAVNYHSYHCKTILSKKGLIDTVSTLTGNSNFYIRPCLTKKYYSFLHNRRDYAIYKLNFRFEILNIYKEVVKTIPISETTNYFEDEGDVFHILERRKNKYDSIMKKSVEDFAISPEFLSIQGTAPFSDSINKIPISIIPLKFESGKMSDYTKSVVTIKTDEGHGSGCVISRNGYILTNYHVIANSKEITVFNNSVNEAKATLIRVSKANDLALIKIESQDLFTLDVLKDDADFGMEIFAIGTPADIQLGQTLSKGIISGKRKFDDVECYQTDVKINPGSSGGALIDKSGNLVGIVCSKLVGRGIEGIGFGIPINVALKALNLNISK